METNGTRRSEVGGLLLTKSARGCTGEKEDGIVRLMYENLNGLNSILSGNDKLEKSGQIIDDMDAEVVSYCEHR